MHAKTRITVSIDADVLSGFNVLKRCGLSIDTLIASTLARELEDLKGITPNGPKARLLVRALSRLPGKRKRLSVTLDRSLAEGINQVCEEKGITRDQFIGAYVSFLVDGDPENHVASPLGKAAMYLETPRTDWNFHSNPYEDLHMSEEDVDWLQQNAGNRPRE